MLHRLIEELRGELLEKQQKPKIPKHYRKDCSKIAQRANVRYFVHKKEFPVVQAVAASLSALRRACKYKGERGSPSKIVRSKK